MFALLLEFCRLRFKHRSIGFFALGLFVLCVLPFILAGVFSNEALGKLSFLAPGIAAFAAQSIDEETRYLIRWTALHFGVVTVLYFEWRRQWKKIV